MDTAKHLLAEYRKINDSFFTAQPLASVLDTYRYREEVSSNLSDERLPRKCWSDVCDYVGGQHILNNSYRIYPSYVVIRAAWTCLTGIMVICRMTV